MKINCFHRLRSVTWTDSVLSQSHPQQPLSLQGQNVGCVLYMSLLIWRPQTSIKVAQGERISFDRRVVGWFRQGLDWIKRIFLVWGRAQLIDKWFVEQEWLGWTSQLTEETLVYQPGIELPTWPLWASALCWAYWLGKRGLGGLFSQGPIVS